MIILFCKYSFTQNLVPNPSFEDTIQCPAGLNSLTNAINWINPTIASPDHFHSCNTGTAGVPSNGFGSQAARTGNSYVGIHTSDFVSSNEYREYIQCELTSPLQIGQKYKVAFFVSLSEGSGKACDNIGAYLSSAQISSSSNLTLLYSPQITSPINAPTTSKTEWTEITGTFMATGGEKYITIGVFTTNANTNWVNVNGGWSSEPYYYIDDVSVIKVDTNVNDTTKNRRYYLPQYIYSKQ